RRASECPPGRQKRESATRSRTACPSTFAPLKPVTRREEYASHGRLFPVRVSCLANDGGHAHPPACAGFLTVSQRLRTQRFQNTRGRSLRSRWRRHSSFLKPT